MGGVFGAAVGGLLTGSWTGAVGGGALGAVVGNELGETADRETREAARQQRTIFYVNNKRHERVVARPSTSARAPMRIQRRSVDLVVPINSAAWRIQATIAGEKV